MSDPDYALEAPITVRYHRQAVDQIIRSVEEGTYCALLGPRLCGKTVLLRYVERTLITSWGWTCLYIDMQHTNVATLQSFFTALIQQVARRIQEQTGTTVPPPEPQLASSAVFRGYLMDCLENLQRDLVLMIDNLDAVPTDLVQALLTSLRAAYMDQHTLEHRLTVVVSGALSLANLTVGESSPFRGIARRVFIGDLSPEQSRELIAEYLEAEGVSFTWQAQQRLLNATSGDAYLIRRLCRRSVEAIQPAAKARLGAKTVNRVTHAFLRDEVYQYAPLVEAVRLIEENPDLLRGILILLEKETVPKAELPLPLSPDLDPLYLTGVVEQAPGGSYRLQNMIYRKFLARHFQPGRVGHMLSMAGLWDEALDYLEAGITRGDPQSLADLLPATIQSMYAAQDLSQAAHFLARGLVAGFSAREVQVWYALPGEGRLRLLHNVGEGADPSLWSQGELPVQADRLEARAYRQGTVLRGGESLASIQRAIPLVIPGRKPVGVVVVRDAPSGGRGLSQRERELQLKGFLYQGARALQSVGTRRYELTLAGRMQASLLPETPPAISGWEITAAWRPARETSGDFYDFIEFNDGQLGIILADVTDKGLGAALYMALSRTLLRTYAAELRDQPAATLQAVNQRMLMDTHGGLFITLFYGLLNPQTGALTYCNAGHHPPYHLKIHQQRPAPLARTGIPLGVSPEARWEEQQIQLAPGDLLLLYTDGIVEAHNADKELFGAARMLEVAASLQKRSAHHLQDALLSAVRAFTGNQPQFDDLTLVMVKRK